MNETPRDWAAEAKAAIEQQQDIVHYDKEYRSRDTWPAAWTLAAALFAGNALKRALEPAYGPEEPTQVVEARVIREDATEAPRALSAAPVSRFQVLQVVLLVVLIVVLLLQAL
jgi:hypothetical protein